jgi:hypothetical protein
MPRANRHILREMHEVVSDKIARILTQFGPVENLHDRLMGLEYFRPGQG